eukprot:scaffold117369_cov36-Phaeocystis_antarctica.AAC.1
MVPTCRLAAAALFVPSSPHPHEGVHLQRQWPRLIACHGLPAPPGAAAVVSGLVPLQPLDCDQSLSRLKLRPPRRRAAPPALVRDLDGVGGRGHAVPPWGMHCPGDLIAHLHARTDGQPRRDRRGSVPSLRACVRRVRALNSDRVGRLAAAALSVMAASSARAVPARGRGPRFAYMSCCPLASPAFSAASRSSAFLSAISAAICCSLCCRRCSALAVASTRSSSLAAAADAAVSWRLSSSDARAEAAVRPNSAAARPKADSVIPAR